MSYMSHIAAAKESGEQTTLVRRHWKAKRPNLWVCTDCLANASKLRGIRHRAGCAHKGG